MTDDWTKRRDNLAAALNPAFVKIDARDRRDRLAFVAKFAQLILYYDQNNQLAGDWQAFFLKDPTLLLAAISDTPYAQYQAIYQEISLVFAQTQKRKTQVIDGSAHIDFINQLGALIQSLFVQFNQWLRFMNMNNDSNDLHLFLQKKIDEVLAEQLRLFIEVQQAMRIKSPDYVVGEASFYRQFESLWTAAATGQFNKAYLYNIHPAELESTAKSLLESVFAKVFGVFVQMIKVDPSVQTNICLV